MLCCVVMQAMEEKRLKQQDDAKLLSDMIEHELADAKYGNGVGVHDHELSHDHDGDA